MKNAILDGIAALVDGWATIISFGTYRPPLSERSRKILERSDADALKSDWAAVLADWDALYSGSGKHADAITIEEDERA